RRTRPAVCVGGQRVERREGPAAVEGPVTVGQDQQEMPTWAAHPPPFTQGRQGGRQVLQGVGREHHIVGVIGQTEQAARLPQVLDAELLAGGGERATVRKV